MKIASILLTILVAAGCKTAAKQVSTVKEGGGRPVGEFIGAPAIQQILWENLFDQGEPGTKSFQVSRVLGDGVFAQKGLIGANETDGDRFEYRGGVPNPLGVLLWFKTMKTLAASMGELCAQAPEARTLSFKRSKDKPVLRADFNLLVRKLCDGTPADGDLEKAWKIVVGYGLDDEREAFKNQFKASTEANAAKRVEDVMLALLMNPSFLLQQ